MNKHIKMDNKIFFYKILFKYQLVYVKSVICVLAQTE